MWSLPDVIAEQTGALTLVAPTYLHLWLPDLATPSGWADSAVDGATVTRMLVRRLGASSHWDGCEVLNLYRAPGAVPAAVVLDNAHRSLRDSGAVDVQVGRIDVPKRCGMSATRATGRLDTAGRTVCGQYSHYVVNTAAGGALIEQVILVAVDTLPMLAPEVEGLAEGVYRSLLLSVDRAAIATSPTALASPGHLGGLARKFVGGQVQAVEPPESRFTGGERPSVDPRGRPGLGCPTNTSSKWAWRQEKIE